MLVWANFMAERRDVGGSIIKELDGCVGASENKKRQEIQQGIRKERPRDTGKP